MNFRFIEKDPTAGLFVVIVIVGRRKERYRELFLLEGVFPLLITKEIFDYAL